MSHFPPYSYFLVLMNFPIFVPCVRFLYPVYSCLCLIMLTPVAKWSEACVCCITGIAGLNPTRGMNVSFL